jgi:hypothetical protein
MKYLTVALLLLFAWQSSAQVMVIHQKGQPDVRIPIADIAKLTFDLSGTTGNIQPMALKKIKTVVANIYPNPFATKIEYSIAKLALVRIRVFNLQGKIMRTVSNSMMGIGHYSTTWNFCNDAGQRVGNAPYIVNVEIDGKSISKSLFIVN